MTSKVLFLLICLASSCIVHEYGTVPQGRTIKFKVTINKIPAQMLYSEDKSAPSLAPFISTSEDKAITFVSNLVKQTVQEVLYQQGRGAGLSDDLISLILQQFDLKINYKPLKCVTVYTGMGAMGESGAAVTITAAMGMKNCEIKGNTLTAICVMTNTCHMPTSLIPTPSEFLTIPGTIETTNAIMAGWSRQMWASVLNRAVQRLASGSFAQQFTGAFATID